MICFLISSSLGWTPIHTLKCFAASSASALSSIEQSVVCLHWKLDGQTFLSSSHSLKWVSPSFTQTFAVSSLVPGMAVQASEPATSSVTGLS